MKNEVEIVIAEDDIGHATLITRNLRRAGINNEIIHFSDGIEVMKYLIDLYDEDDSFENRSILLILDINMPGLSGLEVLRKIKEHRALHKIPVIIITTTDDPREVERCHALGCNTYLTKPIDYDSFKQAIMKLGLFLLVVEIPQIEHRDRS